MERPRAVHHATAMYDEDDWDLDDGPDHDPELELDPDDWWPHPSLTAADRNPSMVRHC